MYRMTVTVFIPGFEKQEASMSFKTFDEAIDQFSNRLFTGDQPKLIVLKDGENSMLSAVGTHGTAAVRVSIVPEEKVPPKELGE